MSFDLALLATKLVRYREQFQRTLAEVADATGISIAELEQYERGTRRPTGDEILILADYYKCDFRFFISNEMLAPFEQTETLFRRYGNHLSKDDRWAIQEFLFLCECEEFLYGELQPFGRTPFQFTKKGRFFKRHGQDAAVSLRQHLGYKANQVGRNVYKDMRRIGFHVFRRELANSDISGLYIRHPVAGKCLLVNYSEDVYRQQFTAAHEAGHAILDDDKDVVVSFTRWDKGDLSEIRANTFASNFLMPPEILTSMPDPKNWDEKRIIEWASRLKVSTTALAFALSSANLIDNPTAERLRLARVPSAVKVDPELPDDLAPASRLRREVLLRQGLSPAYVGLCFEAYERGIVSLRRVAEMLLTDEPGAIALATLFGIAV